MNVSKGDMMCFSTVAIGHFFFYRIHCYILFSSFANYALTDPAFSKMKGQNKYEAKYSETLVHRDLNQTLDMNL